jgi:hypothetical protein
MALQLEVHTQTDPILKFQKKVIISKNYNCNNVYALDHD